MYSKTITELGEFLHSSPTAFHAVDTIRKELEKHGYTELSESGIWAVKPGDKCYVRRNNSSIIAFEVGAAIENCTFHITCSHSDSPTFKLKEKCEISVRDNYTKLNTEAYGGMICSSWYDRPLSIAGRAVVKDGNRIVTKLVKFDRDLVMIPNQAIHMNRDINEHSSYNKQKDTLPLLAGKPMEKGDLHKLVAEQLGVDADMLAGTELYLYNRMEPSVWGVDEEFFSAPQIDDLGCAFASMKAFLNSSNGRNINVYACFDNEEVGSSTKQGAASTFLRDVLFRLNGALGRTEEEFYSALADSFMVSCDNAHAVHPNYIDETDQDNCVYMNEGVVIKSHACQKYTSDAVSTAIFRALCERTGVPFQYFANRSDKASGGTLGNLAMSQVSVNAVDVGLPQLGMHSSYETAGVKDVDWLIQVLEEFYNSHLEMESSGSYTLD